MTPHGGETMPFLNDEQYASDIRAVANQPLPWHQLDEATMVISGATGLIGTFLIDVIMERNADQGRHCRVIALGRSTRKARTRFASHWANPYFTFLECDINANLPIERIGHVDYVLHAASSTHPIAYSTDPIATVITNILGLNNLLNLAAEHDARRFLFASSNEIYGESRADVEAFAEDYCGYIDCNTLRAGYPESKRAGEALCQAYIRQKGLDVVIPRFTRSFGPTMLMSDSKAMSQFIKDGLAKRDIVLKSDGSQYYSYTYVADAVSGLLTCLLLGACGEAYNIADKSCNTTLRDAAGAIARMCGAHVVFDMPDNNEKAGYSTATRAILDASKLKKLGWKAQFDLERGLSHTLGILRRAGASSDRD